MRAGGPVSGSRDMYYLRAHFSFYPPIAMFDLLMTCTGVFQVHVWGS